MRAPFRIGLLGLGHVGGALARRLVDEADAVQAAAGRPITLVAIGSRRLAGRQAPAPLREPERVLALPDLDAVVELIGGMEPAHTYIQMALGAGRQVVTANKQLIAAHGPALARLGPLRFEASVASAIPIVETLAETLAADRVRSLVGILNGTTNFMLDAMTTGASYHEALAEAQRQGMAEADPSADVDAHDPAAKLAILAMLAFRARIDPSSIKRVGIGGLDPRQFREAASTGHVVKLVAALATREATRIEADVRPRLVPMESPIAHVNGPLNVICVEAQYAGTLMLQGAGAGPDAAASAVLADLVRAARDAPASAGSVLAGLADEPFREVQPLGPMRPFPASE